MGCKGVNELYFCSVFWVLCCTVPRHGALWGPSKLPKFALIEPILLTESSCFLNVWILTSAVSCLCWVRDDVVKQLNLYSNSAELSWWVRCLVSSQCVFHWMHPHKWTSSRFKKKVNLFHLLLLVGSSQSKVLSINLNLSFIRNLKEQLQRSRVIASDSTEEYEKGPKMCKSLQSEGPHLFPKDDRWEGPRFSETCSVLLWIVSDIC